MADIHLQWDADNGRADLALVEGDLATDNGLETAVLASLFTDRRAAESDELPDGSNDRRGYWGDMVPPAEGDRYGSRLWLLSREKRTADVLKRAREYAAESLAWMLEDGVASQVQIDVDYLGPDWLAIAADIQRPTGEAERFRFSYNWRAQLLGA